MDFGNPVHTHPRGEDWTEPEGMRWAHFRTRQVGTMADILRRDYMLHVDETELVVTAFDDRTEAGMLYRVFHAVPIRDGFWHVRFHPRYFHFSE